jgi:hypothetical protein
MATVVQYLNACLGFKGYRDDLARHNVADAHSAPLQIPRFDPNRTGKKNRGNPI